jgi:hypothetical protein
MNRLNEIKKYWIDGNPKFIKYEYHEKRDHTEDIQVLIDMLESKNKEVDRYKEINDGLLEVQFELRDKEKTNQQWVKQILSTTKTYENVITDLKRKNKALLDNSMIYIEALTRIKNLDERNEHGDLLESAQAMASYALEKGNG